VHEADRAAEVRSLVVLIDAEQESGSAEVIQAQPDGEQEAAVTTAMSVRGRRWSSNRAFAGRASRAPGTII
jgi:hypothetical protein